MNPPKDTELTQLDERLENLRRQRAALARLREICEPYLRDHPGITVTEALELDRRARPWAYRKPN